MAREIGTWACAALAWQAVTNRPAEWLPRRIYSCDWTKTAYGYGAIHFHEDDLDDASWKTDFSFKIPLEARSGAYVNVQAVNSLTRDDIVFFVRPEVGTPKVIGAKTAFVLSTFTYLAYANERMYDKSKSSKLEQATEDFATFEGWQFNRMKRRSDLGLSLYDFHKDGSGVIYSSPRRPLLKLRPDYIHWALHRPRMMSINTYGKTHGRPHQHLGVFIETYRASKQCRLSKTECWNTCLWLSSRCLLTWKVVEGGWATHACGPLTVCTIAVSIPPRHAAIALSVARPRPHQLATSVLIPNSH